MGEALGWRGMITDGLTRGRPYIWFLQFGKNRIGGEMSSLLPFASYKDGSNKTTAIRFPLPDGYPCVFFVT